MLNVNELTSRMSKMSDDQLRQYARLHKDDPYTLALASSESKRRAQLRAAGQQQATQQPTVADQALAEMGAPAPMPQPQLPEQQGIGMLPAQNVEGMADGGIAGYGDSYAGGGIVAFDKGGLTADERAELERRRREQVEGVFGRLSSIPTAIADYGQRAYETVSSLPFESRNPLIKYEQRKPLERTGILNYERAPETLARMRREDPSYVPPVTDTYPDEALRGSAASTTANVAPTQFTDARSAPPAAPGAGTSKGAAKRPSTKATTAPTVEKAPDFVAGKPGDLTAELERLQKMNPGTKAYDDLSAKIKQGFADLEKAREEGKPKDKAFSGLEALLGKEEEKAKGREARNFNMALVNAGLAIAGGKSQYALQNIAEGAQVGTKQYQEGLDKLEAAALERRKQSAMIEEARRAEARGDWKEAQQYKQKAFEAELGVNQAQIAAVQDLYKTDLKTAADIVNNQNTLAAGDRRTMFEQQQQNIRAREQNVSAERIADKYAASRLAGGAGLRGQITDDDIYKAYNRNMEKDTLGNFEKNFPNFAAYRNYVLQQISGGGGDPYAGWGNLQVTTPK